jgi:hypothetical protein
VNSTQHMSEGTSNPYESPRSDNGNAPDLLLRIVGLMLAAPLVWMIWIGARNFLLPSTILHVLLCLLACRIAVRRGYRLWVGLLPGLLLPALGWLIVAFLPRTETAKDQDRIEADTRSELATSSQTMPCPKCGRLNSVATRICPRCDHHLTNPAATATT